MNTILTRLSTELIEQYTTTGFWRGDTIYSLVQGTRRTRAGHLRGPRPLSAASPIGSCSDAADALAADLARRGVEARPARGGVAAEPDRRRGGAAGLLAQRLRLLPVAAPRSHRRRNRRTDAAHARAPPSSCRTATARMPTSAISSTALKDVPTLRHVYRLDAAGRTTDTAPIVPGIDARPRPRVRATKPIPTRSSISPSPPARPASPRA